MKKVAAKPVLTMSDQVASYNEAEQTVVSKNLLVGLVFKFCNLSVLKYKPEMISARNGENERCVCY